MDLIKIKNTGSKPLVLRHDGKGHVTIDPGKARILSADYAFIYFGHPAARNVGRNKDRTSQYDSARTLWGFYPGLMSEDEWEHTYKPQFECYDMEDNRVYMILDDPDGSLAAANGVAPSTTASDAVERGAVDAQIAHMQSQIDTLTRLLTAQLTGQAPAAPAVAVEPVEDGSGPDPVASTEPPVDVEHVPAETQASRNEKRDDIPKPAADEPPVKADKPRTTRVGKR